MNIEKLLDKMGETPDEIEEGMLREGLLNEEYNGEEDELDKQITEEGLELARELIKDDDDLRVFLSNHIMAEIKKENPHISDKDLVFMSATNLRDSFRVNLFRLATRNPDSIDIIVREKPPEKLLEEFDPDEEKV